MSNVIDFLERMGQDSELRYANTSVLALTLANTAIDPVFRSAIASGSSRQLERSLGAASNVCAVIFPVESEERTGEQTDY